MEPSKPTRRIGCKRPVQVDESSNSRSTHPLACVAGPSGSPCQKKLKPATVPMQQGSSQEVAANRAEAQVRTVADLGQASVVDYVVVLEDCKEKGGTYKQKDPGFGEASGREVCGAEHEKLDSTVSDGKSKNTSETVGQKAKGPSRVRSKSSAGQAKRKAAASIPLANLEDAKGSFTGAVVDYRLPCTGAENRTCQIVGHLSTWNEFLCKAHLELREMPGTRSQLSLSACVGTGQFEVTGEELHQAATLVYWLLRTHQCVAVVDIPASLLDTTHSALLSSALQDSSSIKSLLAPQVPYMGLPKDLCKIIPSLAKLETFECVEDFWVPPAPLKTALGLLLQTAALTCLRIPTLQWRDCRDVRKFLAALVTNSTLEELSVHGSFIEKGSCASKQVFQDYVSNSKTLTTLTVNTFVRASQDSMYAILTGVGANKTLSRVNLVGFEMNAVGATILPVALKQNKSLCSFNWIEGRADFTMDLYPNRYNAWFELFTQIKTLEELTLPMHIWNKGQWQQFFHALAKNRNMKHVTIEVDVLSYVVIFRVYTALQESGAGNKVLFKYRSDFCKPLSSPITSPSKGFTELYIGPGQEPLRECLSRMVRQLPSYTNITSISLDIHQSRWDSGLFLAFSQYVESTTTLRKLRVASVDIYAALEPDATTKSFWMLLVCSLGQNVSIRELCAEMCVDEEIAEGLADVIKTSRNIRRVHLTAYEYCVTGAFVGRLSVGIADNYRLTHATLDELDPLTADGWFEIRSVAARNSSLVARASQYVAGAACDRYRAQALERVSRSPSLIEEVAELTSISNSEAISKIREGLRSFEGLDDFMRLCGVVKEKVACCPRQDGHMQLDELNADCWSRVRHYLSVEDIGVSTVPPAGPPTL